MKSNVYCPTSPQHMNSSHDTNAIYSVMKLHANHLQEAMRVELRFKNAAGFVIDSVEKHFSTAFEAKRKHAVNYENVMDHAARTTQPRYGKSAPGFSNRQGRGRGPPSLQNFFVPTNPHLNPSDQPASQGFQSFRARGRGRGNW